MPGGEFAFCRFIVLATNEPPLLAAIRVYTPLAGTVILNGKHSWPIGAKQTLKIEELREGRHVVEVVANTGARWQGPVEARSDSIPTVRAVFLSTTGAVLLRADRAGIAVIDGQRSIEIQAGQSSLVSALASGQHDILATSGKRTWRDRVAVAENETRVVEIGWGGDRWNESWYITPRVEFSPMTGLAGVEVQVGHFGIDVGSVPTPGPSVGIKYFFNPSSSSCFLGLFGYEGDGEVGRRNGNDVYYFEIGVGVLFGYTWRYSSGWILSIGTGLVYDRYEEHYGDVTVDESEGGYPLAPIAVECSLGYSF